MSTAHIITKVDEIYTDLSTNVTHIYNRQNIHLAIDLVYHSPMRFYFGKRMLNKGYPEVLIIGDTRCGKSETTNSLLRHYRAGAKSSGENATPSGLVGGCQQVRGRWRVTWGRIPLNDGRLLTIDELSGLATEAIASMSDLRSSGFAEITKIQTERTHARTRLIWLSNPRSNDSVNNFGSGTKIIENLIGKPEDIARFDFVIIIEKNEITGDQADERKQPDVPHVYTSDLCHDLVMWAWSRTPEQVRLGAATVDACFDFGKLMGKKYSSDCPIVNTMEQKIKLARLATALACRLYSSDGDGNVIVTPDHVEYIHDFLNKQYDAIHFGYDTFSDHVAITNKMDRPEEIAPLLAKWGIRKVRQMLHSHQITVKTLEEMLGYETVEARVMLSKMLTEGALQKKHQYYVKTPAFIKMLKMFIANPVDAPAEEY